MVLVPRNWDSPIESRARNRQVFQAAFNETNDLVESRVGRAEIGLRLVQVQQLVLVGREFEEVRFLFGPSDFGVSFLGVPYAIIADFGVVLGVEGFVTHRVPARVLVQIYVAVGLHALPDGLCSGIVV